MVGPWVRPRGRVASGSDDGEPRGHAAQPSPSASRSVAAPAATRGVSKTANALETLSTRDAAAPPASATGSSDARMPRSAPPRRSRPLTNTSAPPVLSVSGGPTNARSSGAAARGTCANTRAAPSPRRSCAASAPNPPAPGASVADTRNPLGTHAGDAEWNGIESARADDATRSPSWRIAEPPRESHAGTHAVVLPPSGATTTAPRSAAGTAGSPSRRNTCDAPSPSRPARPTCVSDNAGGASARRVDTPRREGAPAGDAHATAPESFSNAPPRTGPTAPNQHALAATSWRLSRVFKPSRDGDRDTSVPPEAEPAAGRNSATARFGATGTAKVLPDPSSLTARVTSRTAEASAASTSRASADAASAGVSKTATAEDTNAYG